MPEFTLIADSSTGFRTLICCFGHGVFGIPETISKDKTLAAAGQFRRRAWIILSR